MTADGKTEIKSDTLVDTLQMNTDEKALTGENVLGRNGAYQIIPIDTAALSGGQEADPEKSSEAETAAEEESEAGTTETAGNN